MQSEIDVFSEASALIGNALCPIAVLCSLGTGRQLIISNMKYHQHHHHQHNHVNLISPELNRKKSLKITH